LSRGSVAVGDVIAGKYRVEGLLGEGGMGLVVSARHLALDRLVALKLLPGKAADDPVLAGRFLREARAAARLQNEHVAKVIDVGTLPTGSPFMVMEHLEGADLGKVLAQRGPFDPPTACDYVTQACDGVAEAHAVGIVHRDLKPDNLYLTSGVGGGGLIKVLDFGVSKVLTAAEGKLTTTSSIVGSPVYMAPEQMRESKAADARSDVWALGVVLYELLTQRCPFEADTLPDLCSLVAYAPATPIQTFRADLPLELVAIIDRCLEKEPSKRYANAGELATALEPFAPGSSWSESSTARRVSQALASTTPGASTAPIPQRRWGAVFLAAATLGGVLLAAWAIERPTPPQLMARAATVAGRESSLYVETTPPVSDASSGAIATVMPPVSSALSTDKTSTPRSATKRQVQRPPGSRPPVDDIPAFR
jgi:serine/threonine protein kinase